jgi:hypothetical protein
MIQKCLHLQDLDLYITSMSDYFHSQHSKFMKDAYNVFCHKYLKDTPSSPSSYLLQSITFLIRNLHQELYNTVNTSQFINLQKLLLHQSRYFNILSRKTPDIVQSVQQISST